jgi:toxin YoeB
MSQRVRPFEIFEPLKFNYAGFWSRRIDEEHRLIYRVVDHEIQIAKCRFHYD